MKPVSNIAPLVEPVGTQVVVVSVGVSGLEGIEYGREENKQQLLVVPRRLVMHQNDKLLEIWTVGAGQTCRKNQGYRELVIHA